MICDLGRELLSEKQVFILIEIYMKTFLNWVYAIFIVGIFSFNGLQLLSGVPLVEPARTKDRLIYDLQTYLVEKFGANFLGIGLIVFGFLTAFYIVSRKRTVVQRPTESSGPRAQGNDSAD